MICKNQNEPLIYVDDKNNINLEFQNACGRYNEAAKIF